MRNLQERRAVVASVAARRLLIPAVAAVVVAADQATKSWALGSLRLGQPRHVVGSLNLVLTYNTGAAFGLGNGITPIVEAAVIVLIVWLLAASRKASRVSAWPTAVGLGLLLGGALGNLGDRLFRHPRGFPGGVVDFIQAASWWPVFNVADASIVVGVIIVVIAYWVRDHGIRPRG